MIKDTICVDGWICPYCKSFNEEPEWNFNASDGGTIAGMSQNCKCFKCGK